jgi:hypothetical protein
MTLSGLRSLVDDPVAVSRGESIGPLHGIAQSFGELHGPNQLAKGFPETNCITMT